MCSEDIFEVPRKSGYCLKIAIYTELYLIPFNIMSQHWTWYWWLWIQVTANYGPCAPGGDSHPSDRQCSHHQMLLRFSIRCQLCFQKGCTVLQHITDHSSFTVCAAHCLGTTAIYHRRRQPSHWNSPAHIDPGSLVLVLRKCSPSCSVFYAALEERRDRRDVPVQSF